MKSKYVLALLVLIMHLVSACGEYRLVRVTDTPAPTVASTAAVHTEEPATMETPPITPTLPSATLTPTPTPEVSSDLACFAGHPDDDSYSREKAELLYELMGEANVKWIRHDIDQVVAEREQRWPYYDQMLGWAEDQDIGTILTINFTGAADQNWKEVFSTPEKYARYAGDVAEHYAGKRVMYEMGNEPDQDGLASEQYLDFLILGGEAIREAYKEAGIDEEPVIISAGIPNNNAAPYLEAMYAELDRRYDDEDAAQEAKEQLFTYFGYHFQDSFDDLYGIDEVLDVMEAHGVRKQVVITEGGTDRASDDEADQQLQADFIVKMYKTLEEDYSEEVPIACVYRISNKRSDDDLRGVLNETIEGFEPTTAFNALIDYFKP